MHQNRLLAALAALTLLAYHPALRAAELGEAVVKSHIGQPLVADIELLPDEGGAVRAYIAHEDVFRGSNLARSPVLDSLNMSVMRRDGRQFLHITSIKPVEKEYLHLFLELTENGKRTIRPATLWLSPEPAAPVRAAPTVAPAPVAAVARTQPPAPVCKPAPEQHDAACMALDYKNAQLSAQIVDLEEKVKALQTAVDMQELPAAKAAAAPAPAQPAAVRAPAPSSSSAGWIAYAGAGAGVLALAGAGGWFGRRWLIRRKDKPADSESAPEEPASEAG